MPPWNLETHSLWIIEVVTHLLGVDSEGTSGLAAGAERNSDLLHRVLVERTQRASALAAVKLDILELREHARPTGHNTRNPNETVEVALTEISKCIGGGKIGDSDVNLVVNEPVGWVVEEDDLQGDFVKDLEQCLGRVGKEIGKCRLVGSKMIVVDFQRFRVV